jgi:transcriptional regulator GlxA family with amidase domain
MIWDKDSVHRVAVLLLPGFPLMAYASTIEPLRGANEISGRKLFSWRHFSIDGAPVRASSGATIAAEKRVTATCDFDTLLVCAGRNATTFSHRHTFAWIRNAANLGRAIGGISVAPYVLARAGVMQGRQMTIHWEYVDSLRERYPDLLISRNLFEIDRDRLTCAGGTAALDMMHVVIQTAHGRGLAAAVSDWFVHTKVRPGTQSQRMDIQDRSGVSDSRLIDVVRHMESRIDRPRSRSSLARDVGLSTRQLDRLFTKSFGKGLGRHYLELRIHRAQALLSQTDLPVIDVAIACGFASASHFSRAFKMIVGTPPTKARGN